MRVLIFPQCPQKEHGPADALISAPQTHPRLREVQDKFVLLQVMRVVVIHHSSCRRQIRTSRTVPGTRRPVWRKPLPPRPAEPALPSPAHSQRFPTPTPAPPALAPGPLGGPSSHHSWVTPQLGLLAVGLCSLCCCLVLLG